MPLLLPYSSTSTELVSRFIRVAPKIGWVPEPNCGRGTSDILQSCLLTIFFCTLTSLHLNIPNDGDGTRRIMWTRFGWMTATMLAPEICMCVAMTQHLEARIVVRTLDEQYEYYGYTEHHEWTMTHAFYYNMKGFIYKPKGGRFRVLKMKHLFDLVADDQLHLLWKPEEAIKDLSKNDSLAKTLALVQALWFLIQVIARMAEHLPTSPLEISTVAYIACAFFSYLLWWPKPQDVGTATTFDRHFGHLFKSRPKSRSPQRGLKSQLPNKNRPYSGRDKFILGFTFLCIASVFGGLHCLAWNYEFPTTEEALLWRVSSLGMIVLPPIFYWSRVMWYMDCCEGPDFAGIFLVLLYITARLCNLLEVFFSLRATSPALYKNVSWTALFPHF